MSYWYKLYSPKINQISIEKLLKKFKIEKYNFTYNGYGDYDIFIAYKLYNYKLEIDENQEKLFLYKIIYKRKGGKKKPYLNLIKTFHNDVYYNSLKEITK